MQQTISEKAMLLFATKRHLSEQRQLSKAGALADSCQLILIIIVDGDVALLHHVEHIPCM